MLALGSQAVAQDRESAALKPEPADRDSETTADYFISHHPAEKIRVAECGFTVSLFALEHFGVPYELLHVKAALPATERGIRLADIRDLLAAYGLECEARQNVKPDGLARSVKAGYLAIFPILAPNQSDHYLVGMMRESGEPVVIDVLRRVYPLHELDFESHGSAHKGVVLFVRPTELKSSRHRKPLNTSVQATPTAAELGAFALDGPAGMVKRRAEIVLENTSSKPVLIKTVSVSCGCTDLDWKGGLIRAGAKQSVSITARPVAWGAGKQRKGLTFQFLDDTELKVEVVGEGRESRRGPTALYRMLQPHPSCRDWSRCSSVSGRPVRSTGRCFARIVSRSQLAPAGMARHQSRPTFLAGRRIRRVSRDDAHRSDRLLHQRLSCLRGRCPAHPAELRASRPHV